jgi:hypothetical protein
MYLANFLIKKTSGLKFYKLLGTGAGAGFSLYPDFSTYSILCVWDNLSQPMILLITVVIPTRFLRKLFQEMIIFLNLFIVMVNGMVLILLAN